jgi:hypothetical protein
MQLMSRLPRAARALVFPRRIPTPTRTLDDAAKCAWSRTFARVPIAHERAVADDVRG